MSESPPKDCLHRRLWMMGHNEEQRQKIIEASKTTGLGVLLGPIELGQFLARMQPSAIDVLRTKQSRLTRFKFWLRRVWRKLVERGRYV